MKLVRMIAGKKGGLLKDSLLPQTDVKVVVTERGEEEVKQTEYLECAGQPKKKQSQRTGPQTLRGSSRFFPVVRGFQPRGPHELELLSSV